MTDASTGTITADDPSVSIKFQFQNLTVSPSGTITAITADGTNFLGKISADGKQITGDITGALLGAVEAFCTRGG